MVVAEEFRCYALSRLAKALLLPVPDQRKTIQDIGCAEASYNKQNPGAEYELVEAIQCNAFVNNKGGVWHHVNFTAKPKNNVADHASPKLFFVELNFKESRLELYLAGNERLICRCSIVDHNSSETVPGCGYCYSGWLTKMYHVVGFFEYGCFKSKRPDPIWPCLGNGIPSLRVLA